MKIKELLSDSSKWIKGVQAEDEDNEPISPVCSLAVKWCLLGALHKCYPGPGEFYEAQNKIDKVLKIVSFVTWNDAEETTFEDVQKLLLEADV